MSTNPSTRPSLRRGGSSRAVTRTVASDESPPSTNPLQRRRTMIQLKPSLGTPSPEPRVVACFVLWLQTMEMALRESSENVRRIYAIQLWVAQPAILDSTFWRSVDVVPSNHRYSREDASKAAEIVGHFIHVMGFSGSVVVLLRQCLVDLPRLITLFVQQSPRANAGRSSPTFADVASFDFLLQLIEAFFGAMERFVIITASHGGREHIPTTVQRAWEQIRSIAYNSQGNNNDEAILNSQYAVIVDWAMMLSSSSEARRSSSRAARTAPNPTELREASFEFSFAGELSLATEGEVLDRITRVADDSKGVVACNLRDFTERLKRPFLGQTPRSAPAVLATLVLAMQIATTVLLAIEDFATRTILLVAAAAMVGVGVVIIVVVWVGMVRDRRRVESLGIFAKWGALLAGFYARVASNEAGERSYSRSPQFVKPRTPPLEGAGESIGDDTLRTRVSHVSLGTLRDPSSVHCNYHVGTISLRVNTSRLTSPGRGEAPRIERMTITSWNDAMQRLTGFDSTTMTTAPLSHILADGISQRGVTDLIRRALAESSLNVVSITAKLHHRSLGVIQVYLSACREGGVGHDDSDSVTLFVIPSGTQVEGERAAKERMEMLGDVLSRFVRFSGRFVSHFSWNAKSSSEIRRSLSDAKARWNVFTIQLISHELLDEIDPRDSATAVRERVLSTSSISRTLVKELRREVVCRTQDLPDVTEFKVDALLDLLRLIASLGKGASRLNITVTCCSDTLMEWRVRGYDEVGVIRHFAEETTAQDWFKEKGVMHLSHLRGMLLFAEAEREGQEDIIIVVPFKQVLHMGKQAARRTERSGSLSSARPLSSTRSVSSLAILLCDTNDIERHILTRTLCENQHAVCALGKPFLPHGARLLRSATQHFDVVVINEPSRTGAPIDAGALNNLCREFSDVVFVVREAPQRKASMARRPEPPPPASTAMGGPTELLDIAPSAEPLVQSTPRNLMTVNIALDTPSLVSLMSDVGLRVSRISDAKRKRGELGNLLKEQRLHWIRGRLLGTGSFGNVYEADIPTTGGKMAVKTIRLQGQQDKTKALVNEIALMSKLQHPNIVAYLYSEQDGDTTVNIFMELCDSSLLSRISGRYVFDAVELPAIIRQACAALEYIHSHGIIHRDIKPGNILLSSGVVKLADFGTAAVARKGKELKDTAGTFAYMAPEVWAGEAYSYPCDIWSIGCVVIDMLGVEVCKIITGTPPGGTGTMFVGYFNGCETDEQVWRRLQAGVQAGHLLDFLKACLHIKPADRATASELLLHPFLSEAEVPTELEGQVQN